MKINRTGIIEYRVYILYSVTLRMQWRSLAKNIFHIILYENQMSSVKIHREKQIYGLLNQALILSCFL